MKSRKTKLTRTPSDRRLLQYLDTKARRLEQAIQHQQELIKLPAETRGDLFDEAAEATEQAQSIGVLEQLNRELEQVQTARKRVLEGRYGICEDCGRRIPTERLKVLPYATLCVRCQTLRGPGEDADRQELYQMPRAR